jgi:hypothetical protein
MALDRSPEQQRRIEALLHAMGEWTHRRLGAEGAFAAEVQARMAEVEGRCDAFRIDGPSADIVTQVAAVVAIRDVLVEAGVPETEALDAIVEAMARWVRQNAAAYSLARLGIREEAPQEAFANARENFKARGEQRFGAHFRYEQEVADEDRSFVAITRCLFHELGRFLQRPQVVRVFCAMDMVWAEHATRPPFNLAFERPTTLAAGGDKCRFQFFRRDPA